MVLATASSECIQTRVPEKASNVHDIFLLLLFLAMAREGESCKRLNSIAVEPTILDPSRSI